MGVHEKYLDWMYDKVYLDKRTPSYKRLFEVLDSIIFLPIHVCWRYRWG